MLTQFVAAFDDIVIGRFNKDRVEKDKIEVRYVYAPKQRVLYDIINENKTLTLPVVSVNVTNVSRDENRVFNKLDGFYYSAKEGTSPISRHLKSPVPINITLSMSIMSRYQTDMDQILSNFVPFCNPYVIISWLIPEKFGLSVNQEIRSEVLWNGDVNLSYPVELNASQKARVTADTTFTIKGWLFKDLDTPSGNIFFIDQNFHSSDKLEFYDNFETLSGVDYEKDISKGLDTSYVERFTLSGNPQVTDVYFNNIRLETPLSLSNSVTGSVTVFGNMFSKTERLLLSSSNFDSTIIDGVTATENLVFANNFTNQNAITGYEIDTYSILNDNVLTFNLPEITSVNNVELTFVPYNTAGYDDTNKTNESQTFSGFNTFILIKGSE